MTETIATGGGDLTEHGFALPPLPDSLTWNKVEDPLALEVGQFVLACRLVDTEQHPSVRPKDEISALNPLQRTEYGPVTGVIQPLHPNAQGYIHMAPRDDGVVRGTRVLPATLNGYIFFRPRGRIDIAEVEKNEVPDPNIV